MKAYVRLAGRALRPSIFLRRVILWGHHWRHAANLSVVMSIVGLAACVTSFTEPGGPGQHPTLPLGLSVITGDLACCLDFFRKRSP